MEPNENKSAYVNIKDLFITVLRKAAIILLAAVILGGVLFGYKFAQKTITSNVLDTETRLSGESDAKYESRLQKIDRARDIVMAMSNVNKQIDNQRGYITDSVFMQIDAENEYEATVQVLITLDETSAAGLDDALISAYNLDFEGGNYLQGYADDLGVKKGYLKELVTYYSSPDKSASVVADAEISRNISMYVKVKGPSQDFIDIVSDLIVQQFYSSHDTLNLSVAKHTMKVIGVQKIIRVDSATRDSQANQTAKLETLQKQITGYNDSLDTIAKDLGLSGKEDLINHFANESAGIAATSGGEVSVNSRIKSSLKFGIIGFAAGIILAAVAVVLRYIFAKKVSTQAQFFSVFTDIKKIGVMKPSFKRSGLGAKLDIKSEDDTMMSLENNRKLICANYDNLTKGMNKVLITGTGDKKAITDAVKAAGLKGDLKVDIFSNPDILKSVYDYDGVVIVEQRKVSLYRTVKNEISLISNSGVKIVGAIII